MSSTLCWGIIGTGRIAGQFASDLAQSQTGKLVAVASRTQAAADAFVAKYPGVAGLGNYAALLANPDVKAVYIATPHPSHIEWAVKAAQAGKHVLCEKPLGINQSQGLRMVEAARLAKVTLMEAFMYRCHPQTFQWVDWVRNGAIGTVQLVQANFGFAAAFDAEARLWSKQQAGGAILDVGCYPVSAARLIAGAAAGKAFAEPYGVKASGRLDPRTGVDAFAAAQLTFDSGLVAQVATSISAPLDPTLRIFGTKGSIRVPNPWQPAPLGGTCTSELLRAGASAPEVWTAEVAAPLYALEADAFAAAALVGRHEVPAMGWGDTLGNLKTLDRWRAEIGLAYPGE